jgi:hypothetical protein
MQMLRHMSLWIVLSIGLIAADQTALEAQEIAARAVEVYVQADTIRLDIRLDSVFTADHLEAIESGMTASIALQFRLVDRQNNRIAMLELNSQLEHDIWEGQYRLIHLGVPADTLVSNSFEQIRLAATDIQNIPISRMPRIDDILTLQARVAIDPITPEQRERTRRWLNILKKGSLLEFFFSFRKSTHSSPWMNLLQFYPGALPQLIQGESP